LRPKENPLILTLLLPLKLPSVLLPLADLIKRKKDSTESKEQQVETITCGL